MSNISSTIKYLREQAELSQNQLARQSDVSVGFISKLEAGQYKTVSLDKCQQLAKGLGLTLKDLLDSLGFLENSSTPSASHALQHALRGSGYNATEVKKVIDFAEYLKHQRHE
ncbi:MAG: hypothetical protein A3C02_04465 [Candidatus Andersenbacteria bacterium RIFCSPHIGHO2_02_FULL_45_11]|uniref:HTH cro/C1-type domain-containing protein n=1 Tax=Candidatus Andersenbacteria bacterium RIFCSPHIGHO2_12_FULL_45_11 TaxID=1797281 RepID=A0A1G1X3C9_9BACT|nr:MAG: hypothetical protein A2805_02825 [Candidatus Andersenbacteria bacterium RIFCSPHIGHO2_01_FULL_46_36]OGY32163.1 MAG: hypothetical protein A3C02_04465 [Candidatus Andersenbacteria bacterium RIFCSPHIGHO2_02_FULL_45_11]OGY34311.1 MAG: hypothetical protein A3D99_04565 [Candidatus Andersenbacteria bacterium RIFCSPHIGHO2_12_FULL_45_11]